MEPNRTSRMTAPAFGKASAVHSGGSDKPIEPQVSASADDGGEHHRSAHRQRTLKAAKAVMTDWTAIDCTIRDISATGARLVFGDAFKLPEEFRVIIVMTNTIRPVRLLWQRGLTAGVSFTGPEEPVHAHHHKPGETHQG
jgi:hypothetical protein